MYYSIFGKGQGTIVQIVYDVVHESYVRGGGGGQIEPRDAKISESASVHTIIIMF